MALRPFGFGSPGGEAVRDFVDVYQPAEGQVIVTRNSAQNGTIVLDPQAALGSVTLQWVDDAVSEMGQRRAIAVISGLIDDLQVPGVTFINGQPAMSTSDFFEFQKISSNTWMRIL